MQNACMPTSITIRHVPDETRDELAARAARSGRSLQEYLRQELIKLADRPDMGELMERIREQKRRAGTRVSAESILEHLHADRE